MYEIRIPRLGWSMEEGVFQGWLKKHGETVEIGDPLFELEGEKALQEIESVDDGLLHIPPDAPTPGSTVHVGALLGYLLAPGELPPTASPTIAPTVTAPAPSVTAIAPSPTARLAKPVASPRARRIAEELGIDWTQLAGSGRGGRIREADIRAAGVKPQAAAGLSPRRQSIAERLRISRDRTIPVTLTATADATGLYDLRQQFKSLGGAQVPGFTEIIASLTARVLKRHPPLAVRRDERSGTLTPVAGDDLHIGIAVDTPDGLLVPVLRNVVTKPLPTLAEESKSLFDRARLGKLKAEEMQGGVFTISNLGGYGIQGFTPIINYPEVAILGLGAIQLVPVVTADERIIARRQLTLSLTFDHALIDGAPAAHFLHDLVQAIENAAATLLNS